jgi:arylsulfatase A
MCFRSGGGKEKPALNKNADKRIKNRFIQMKKKNLLRAVLTLFVLGLSGTLRAAEKPNIIIILADDLGYGDLGCYGHPSIHTPNLDRMAAEGLRFTDFYAGACLCTPSRAGLLTGRLAVRSGMAGGPGRHVLYPNNKGGLPQDEVTIARALKTKGYTTGCIGKWHLGDAPEYMPLSHGFDFFFGLPYSNDMDAISAKARQNNSMSKHPNFHDFNLPLMRNKEIIERPADQTQLTKRYTEEAIDFIKSNKKKPFFLYFAHTFPHVPLFASEQFKGKSPRGIYGDAVEEVDWSVGRVLEALSKEHLEKNTLVIFTSDNGPWLIRKWNGGSSGLLRDGKGGTWEGGYRVPAIARWPGKIKTGVTYEMASGLDLYNTCLTLAGADIPKDRPLDGVDMTPILFGKGKSNRDIQFYYYGEQLYAVRKGAYKAHFTTHDGYSKDKEETHNPPLLFNLSEDPSEAFDVAGEHVKVVAELTKVYQEQCATVTHGKLQY